MKGPITLASLALLAISAASPLTAQVPQHAALLGSAIPSATVPAEVTDTVAPKVDALFAEWDRPGSPGAALAVIRDGAIIYSRGYGSANLEYDVPIRPSSIFHVASVSKHFTAFAILLLAEEGKLSLDDDIRRYVPEVPEFGRTITLRHLIHHTSGMRDQWELLAMAGWRLDDVITREHILKMVSHQQELNFNPGDEYLYSNTGYTLMALIVERVSGKTFRDFTKARIFQPLGMTRTHFHDDHEMIVPGRAYSYAPRADGGFRHSPLNYANAGATSLFTTVEDLAKWDRNFYEPQVGTAATIQQMHEQGVLNSGKQIEYAYALSIGEYRGLRTVGHSGADAGYRAYYVRFPDQRLSVVILSNLSTFNPTRVAMQVADIFLADQFPRRAAPRSRTVQANPRAVRLSAEELSEVAGVYASAATEQLRRIRVQNGKLMLLAGPGYELSPLSATRFRVLGASSRIEITFEPTGNGNAPFRLHETVDGGRPTLYEAAVSLTPEQLAEYSGTYYSEELGTAYTLILQHGKLIAQHRRHEDTALAPLLRDRFLGTNWWFRSLQFTRDAQNRIDGFTLTGGRARNLRFVKQPE